MHTGIYSIFYFLLFKRWLFVFSRWVAGTKVCRQRPGTQIKHLRCSRLFLQRAVLVNMSRIYTTSYTCFSLRAFSSEQPPAERLRHMAQENKRTIFFFPKMHPKQNEKCAHWHTKILQQNHRFQTQENTRESRKTQRNLYSNSMK